MVIKTDVHLNPFAAKHIQNKKISTSHPVFGFQQKFLLPLYNFIRQ